MLAPRAAALGLSLLLAACAADTTTASRRPPPPPAASTISGATLGAVLGGRRERAAVAVGAGASAVAGDVSAYVDRLERDLRARTSGSDVDVVRRGGNLDLRMRSTVAFDFNASTVRSAFRRTLDDIAQTLATYRSTFVDISGHSDAMGTDAVNQKLSDERAAAVADYLSRLGVNRARIATRGYGKTMPVASNADEAGRAQNRRVEIHLSPIVDDDVRGRR